MNEEQAMRARRLYFESEIGRVQAYLKVLERPGVRVTMNDGSAAPHHGLAELPEMLSDYIDLMEEQVGRLTYLLGEVDPDGYPVVRDEEGK
ncbi:MAG: hypothetical protein QHC90_25180 [Shinella sp.]|nr:hypothetical protein [Shinella sp.]